MDGFIFLFWPFLFCFSTASVLLKYFIDSIVSMSSPVVMVPGQSSVQAVWAHVSSVTVTPDTCPGPGVSGQCPHVVTHSANITRNIYSMVSTHS